MKKKYISFDIEAAGPKSPGVNLYSMISLGACVVGDTSKQFYRELKPINGNFIRSAMEVSSGKLECLNDMRHLSRFQTDSCHFRPKNVLEILYERGMEPKQAMQEYRDWILEVTEGYRPIAAAAPIVFDGAFVNWYFAEYGVENPLGHSGEDINSMYRGVMKDENAHVYQLGIRGKDLPHHALEDAVIQAKEMERVLRLMRVRLKT